MPDPGLPILTFHALEEGDSVLSFSPRHFEHLVVQLRDAGWRCFGLREAIALSNHGGGFPPCAFVITFDDGYRSVYGQAFPVLMEYDMTATVFLATGDARPTRGGTQLLSLNGREMLHWAEIREMNERGIAFGAHTLTHPDLRRLPDAEVERELRDSQALIAEALGGEITTMAYPFGRYDARSRAIAAQYFEGACSDRLGLVNARSDVYALERVDAYYLRAAWTRGLMTSKGFPWYLGLRNIPRKLRRSLIP